MKCVDKYVNKKLIKLARSLMLNQKMNDLEKKEKKEKKLKESNHKRVRQIRKGINFG